MWIYSHNALSGGATELAEALGAKRIKHDNSRFVGKADRVVINWGSSRLPEEVLKCRVINRPEEVVKASNKLTFFRTMSGVDVGIDTYLEPPRIPPYTTDVGVALRWQRDGMTVVGRQTLTGSGGEGIVFWEPNEAINEVCPLYTRYIPKKDEYRVHFMDGRIIDFQRKALRSEVNPETVNWKVRNLENGFVFVRGDVVLPRDVEYQAQRAINALELDFGAIDLIFNEKSGRAYVLEVNTAPGLTGTTVASYTNAFTTLINGFNR